jgi:hypothetical protein
MGPELPRPTVLRAGLHLLGRHPLASLGLALLFALLSALGAFLHWRLALPEGEMAVLLVARAALLPMDLYAVPRLLAFLDADTRDDPRNPSGAWAARFEERWLRAFLARVLLGLGVGAGLVLILPGLALLACFGWMPMRVLLRGERLGEAARGSLRLMARAWPAALRGFLALLLVYAALLLALGAGLEALVPRADAWTRLANPLLHVGRFAAGLLALWFEAGLLALYQHLEALAEATD